MTHEATTVTDVFQETLIQRCLALGLAVWPCDGHVRVTPQGDDATLQWLHSPLLGQQVQRIVSAWADDAEPRPVEMFSGCWLIPIVLTNGGPSHTIIAANLFTNASLDSSKFKEVCSSAGLSFEEGRRSLSTMIQPSSADPNQLRTMLQWCCTDLAQGAQNTVTLDEFSEQLIQSYEESTFIYRLARLLHSASGPFAAYETACGQIHQIMPFGWIASVFGADTSVEELTNQIIVAGELPCDQEVFNRSATVLINQFKSDDSDSTLCLQPDSNQLASLVNSEVVMERITIDEQLVGLLLAGNKQGLDSEVASNETQFLEASAYFLSVYCENIARFEEQHTLLMGTLQALTASIDAKDRYTCGHSERVSLLGTQLAVAMGLDAKRVEQVRISGLVHDVGKIG
ncbi:MAG: hypothetical protein QGH33_13065, partial [Pirellulaceae bacterium]|nr:hypothetical protein [Pirellulaceae bacterium]